MTNKQMTPQSSFSCLNCGAMVSTIRNPHYGVGLAVHQFVRFCATCHWVQFALSPSTDEQPVRVTTVTMRQLVSRVKNILAHIYLGRKPGQ